MIRRSVWEKRRAVCGGGEERANPGDMRGFPECDRMFWHFAPSPDGGGWGRGELLSAWGKRVMPKFAGYSNGMNSGAITSWGQIRKGESGSQFDRTRMRLVVKGEQL